MGDREIHVGKLTDLQSLHLLRHAKILQKDDIDTEVKVESADRMFAILATIVTDPTERAYLTKLEEEGKVELKDLLSFVGDSEDTEPEKPKVRRGRPRKIVAA